MSVIKVKETVDDASQTLRVVLTNELGHMCHDMTLPLVTTIEKDGVLEHTVTDVDSIIADHVKMHEKRHEVFLQAKQRRQKS